MVKKYIGKRMLQLLPILLGITLLSFVLTNLASSDAVDLLESNTGRAMSETEKEQMRVELGLDKSLPEQYVNWLKGVLKGDMGTSFISGKPVFETFRSKLPATIELTLVSVLMMIVLAVPLGILSAVRKNTVLDGIIRFFSFLGNSLPGFFVALLLLYLFSVRWKILPVMGNGSWNSVLLPAFTLAFSMAAKYTRQIRAAVLEELNKGYVQGARARGVREQKILYGSVLKCAMMKMLTLLALSIGSLLGGTAIVESIFLWDGVGKMAVDAISMRDYPLIQAYVIWMAVIYVLVNLVTDLLYYRLDPRIRREDV